MAPTGLRLAEEAQELWRWRNGVSPSFTADLSRVPVGGHGNGDVLWVDCRGDPSGPAPLIYWYLKDYNEPDELARMLTNR